MAVIPIADPQRKPTARPTGIAVFALGFRPFYLLAAIEALLFLPLWLLMVLGQPVFEPSLPSLLWHGHEMIFGFASAVIVGFLFTAGRNWTGLQTPRGGLLAALALLWLAGRLGLILLPPLAGALVDLAFLPVCAILLGKVLIQARSQRNYVVLLILSLLTLLNLAFHLAWLGFISLSAFSILHAAVGLIATLATLIAGRIIPSFTANALKTIPHQNRRVDSVAILSTAVALQCWAFSLPGPLTAGVSLLAAASQTWRCLGWRPLPTWRVPMLWILHLSHAWLIIALCAAASSALGYPGGVAVLHLLTVGMISGLIVGMMTRTALGHSGRLLRASWVETAAYALLAATVPLRVLPPLIAPELYRLGLMISGTTWSICFLLYLLRYTPILISPRIDGREG